MKIAIWWNIPCKSIVPVARELSEMPGVDVTFISESDLSSSRKNLGWDMPEFGDLEYRVLPLVNWREDVKKQMYSDYDLHIFNGVYYFRKLRFALDTARKLNRTFGVISEAYHNPYTGIKRVLKKVYSRVVTPFRVLPRVRKAKFLLSASGDIREPFINLGWRSDQIYPFGYFPENNGLEFLRDTKSSEPNLLCTGLINKNKGQHLLVHALSNLVKDNIEFRCTITGTGPEELRLRDRVNQMGLGDYITFTGVVSDAELNRIKARADLFIAPGLEEPWGIRVNEALLCGTPAITSDGIGASELVRYSGAGRVFKKGSVDSLTVQLRQILNGEELNCCKSKAIDFSRKITPKAAAYYLMSVVNYTVNDMGPKPIPIWISEA